MKIASTWKKFNSITVESYFTSLSFLLNYSRIRLTLFTSPPSTASKANLPSAFLGIAPLLPEKSKSNTLIGFSVNGRKSRPFFSWDNWRSCRAKDVTPFWSGTLNENFRSGGICMKSGHSYLQQNSRIFVGDVPQSVPLGADGRTDRKCKHSA